MSPRKRLNIPEEWVFLTWFGLEVGLYLVAFRWQFFVGHRAASVVDVNRES